MKGVLPVMTDLEKIDILRARLGISYREAKEALDAAGGDIVEALIAMEKKQGKLGHEVLDQLKDWVRRGGQGRLRVKQGDRTVFEIPATLGAVGLLGAVASSELAVLGLVGLLTAMTKNYTLEIDCEAEGTAGAGPEPGLQN